MKIVVFGPQRRVGVLDGSRVIDVNAAYASFARQVADDPLPYAMANAVVPSSLQEFILGGQRSKEGAHRATEHVASAGEVGLEGERLVVPLSETRLQAPLASMGARLVMSAGNYADHIVGIQTNRNHRENVRAEDVTRASRERGPRAFWKQGQHVVGPEADVVQPERTQLFDYEAEVAVIIGRPVRDHRPGTLSDYLWGITLVNDLSCRDPQNDGIGDLALSLGKNFDTSAPMGPCIVVDEGIDPQNVSFQTRVSGELRQDGNTKDMIFSFDELLAYASRDMTFQPGDMICAGTSGGTANDSSTWDEKGQKPVVSKFLKPGDVIEISAPLIGILRNRVIAKK